MTWKNTFVIIKKNSTEPHKFPNNWKFKKECMARATSQYHLDLIWESESFIQPESVWSLLSKWLTHLTKKYFPPCNICNCTWAPNRILQSYVKYCKIHACSFPISVDGCLRYTEHFRVPEIYLLIMTHNLSHCAQKRIKHMYQLGIQKSKSSIVFMVLNKTCWVNLYHLNWTIL